MGWTNDVAFDFSSATGLTLGTGWSVSSGRLRGTAQASNNYAYPTTVAGKALRRYTFAMRTPDSTSKRGAVAWLFQSGDSVNNTNYLFRLYTSEASGGVFRIRYGAADSSADLQAWSADTDYTIEIIADADADKVLSVKIGGTTYDNGGAGWEFKKSAGAMGTIAFDDYLASGTLDANVDSLAIDYYELAAPDLPTLAGSGTQDGRTLGADKYGNGWVGIVAAETGDAPTGVKVYTAATEGGSYTERTADEAVVITNPATGHWLCHFARPAAFAVGPFADGATVWVKVKATNSAGDSALTDAVSWVSESDKAQILADKFTAYATYVDSLEGDYVPYDQDHAYWALLALAYMYHETENATHLTYVENQWDHLVSFTNADGLVAIPIGDPDFISRYRSSSAIAFSYFAQRLLRSAGQTTLANTILTQCDSWAQAMLDHLPMQSCESKGMSWLQAEWQATHAYSIGDVVAAVADNGHQYRCTTAGTSGGSEPVWPTDHGATVEDDGVVWTEDTFVADMWPDRFDYEAPYDVGEYDVFVHPNQMLVTAVAFAGLCKDALSAFYGSATAQGIVDDVVGLVMPVLNWSTGQMPYREDTVYWPQATNYDTIYGAYSLFSGSLLRYLLGAAYSDRLTGYMTKGLSWLNTSYSTEPTLGWFYVDNAVQYYCAMQAGCHDVACRFEDVENPVELVRWSTALNVADTDYAGEYDQHGIVENPDTAAYQDRFFIWDATALSFGDFALLWVTSLVINAGAASTDDNDVTLTIAATADGVAPDDMAFSGDGATWGAWEAYATSRAYQLPAQDDEDPHVCTVYVKFRAGAEESEAVSDSITLQIDWSYLSCRVNGGEAATPALGVELALKALSSADSSTNGEPDYYRLRENAGAWSGWTAFEPNGRRGWMTIPYELGGYGVRLLEVQYQDDDGNTSPTVSATITALAPHVAAEMLSAEPAQTVLTGVLAYLDATLVAELRVTGGSVTADARNAVMRTASLEFAPGIWSAGLPVAGRETHRDVYELLCTPGLELVVRRGWITPYGGEVIVSLGRFIVEEVAYTEGEDGTAVGCDCSDLAVRIQRARWSEPYQVASGTALATAIAELLRDRWPAVTIGFDAVSVPDTLGAGAVFEGGADSDPWADAQKLAEAHGYVLYPDAEGVFRLRTPPDPANAAPVWSFARDDGAVIVEQTRTAPMERVYNGVIATGESSELDVPVRGEAWDEAADSPTSIHGAYGLVPYFYSSPLITTGGQAESASASILATILGRLEQLAWRQIPNPALAPLDPVEVEDEDGIVHSYILDQYVMPLGPSEAMTATARETRLAVR